MAVDTLMLDMEMYTQARSLSEVLDITAITHTEDSKSTLAKSMVVLSVTNTMAPLQHFLPVHPTSRLHN